MLFISIVFLLSLNNYNFLNKNLSTGKDKNKILFKPNVVKQLNITGFDERLLYKNNTEDELSKKRDEFIKIHENLMKKQILDMLLDNHIDMYTKMNLIDKYKDYINMDTNNNDIKPFNLLGGGLMDDWDF
jgi:hypothetical protein